MNKIVYSLVAAGIAATAAAAVTINASSAQSTGSALATDASHNIFVPAVDYRRDWVQLGTFSLLADKPADGAKQMHVVYAERANVEAYLKSGKFPDGTVLVKDVFATKTEAMTTGTASYSDKLAGRFVMVKDEANKLAGKTPLWGDGWGWAFFEGNEAKKPVTKDYKAECLTCHEPARSTDLLYIQGYPILRK